MVKIMTMVGEIEVDDNTDWGDEAKMSETVRSELKGNGGNIRVCIRVRPPNQRELALPGGVIVSVPPRQPGSISVARQEGDPGEPRNFILDITFPFTIGQLECFQDVGVEIVQTAYQGFNASLFAYGQTSSGKSFSMMGVRGTALVGLIPRIAHLLFYTIATDTEREFFVEGSYLEIYNEQIKDLMDKNNTETLKVRESPQLGVHVAGLSRHHVKTSDDCEKLIEDGTGNRTVAATKYNSESSRSHAVFELHIQQKYVDKLTMEEMNSKTKICLIDLAGSERSDKLGSVGTALKEGNNINKSLTVLGRCIKGLVEQCNNPKKKIQVPFRESVLTWYLRDSLAGNSRTTMLACVSPAGSNEEETLSTLRYAASAKQIKTSAVKQEDPLKAKVRELSEEVERLKKALQESGARLPDAPGSSSGASDSGSSSGGSSSSAAGSDSGASSDSSALVTSPTSATDRYPTGEYIASLNDEEREAYLQELQESLAGLMPGGFQLSSSSGSMDSGEVRSRQESPVEPAVSYPLLSCLNKDDLLSHAMKIAVVPPDDGAAQFTIGRSGGARENDFTLNGVGMQVRHAAFHLSRMSCGGNGDDSIEESDWERRGNFVQSCVSGASVMVNGEPLPEGGRPKRLTHGDRITFGPCRMIALWCEKPLTLEETNAWTYDAAFQELMGHESIAWALLSPVRRRLLDRLKEAEILYVEQANAIASEMSTTVRFHATVVLGDGVRRLHASHASIDDLINEGDDGGPGAEVVVVCTVVRAGEDERRASIMAQEQAAKKAVRDDNRRMLGSMPNPPSFLDDTLALDEELGRASVDSLSSPGGGGALFDRFDMGEDEDSSSSSDLDLGGGSAPGPVRSKGVHRGMSINMFHNTLETLAEDDDDDLMSGVRDLSGPPSDDDENNGTGGGALVKGSSGGETNGQGTSARGGSNKEGRSSIGIASSFGGAISGRESNVLFSMKMDKFEDLVSELKQLYATLGTLSYGVKEVAAVGGERFAPGLEENIVGQIFETICAEEGPDGTITRSDLTAAFNLFDETSQDPGFAKRMMRELLPEGVSHLDYSTYAGFLTMFVQQQFYAKIEPYVSNQVLFVSIGGRDVSAVIDAERVKGERFEQRAAEIAQELETANAQLSTAQREINRLLAKIAEMSEDNNATAGGMPAQQALENGSSSQSGASGEGKARPQPSRKKSAAGIVFDSERGDDATGDPLSPARPASLKKKSSGFKDGSGDGSDAGGQRPGLMKKKKSWSVFNPKGVTGSGANRTEDLEASMGDLSVDGTSKDTEKSSTKKSATFAPAVGEPISEAIGEAKDPTVPERPKFGRPNSIKRSSGSLRGAGGDDLSLLNKDNGQFDDDDEDDLTSISILDQADPMGTWLGKLGLGGYRGEIEALGIYALKDLLNPDMVGEDELLEAGFENDEVDIFNEARQDTRIDLNLTPPRMRPPSGRLPRSGNNKFFLDANEGSGAEPGNLAGGEGDANESNSVFQNHRGNSLRYGDGAAPLFVQQPLEQLIDGPVVLVNWRSKRKLYAQTCKKPTMFETWAKGFGAGPELKTFKDNKWWLLPQGDNIYVVVNGYSSRKLFAKQLQRGAKWELNCGAGPSEETGSDTLWRIEQDGQTGAFVVQNVQSKRKLFARMPHRGDKWSAGVGAAPSSHVGTETLWNIMQDDAPHEGTSEPTEMSHFWAAHLQQTGAASDVAGSGDTEAPGANLQSSSNEPASGLRGKESATAEKRKSSKTPKSRSSSSRDLDGSSSSSAKPDAETKKTWFQSKKKSTSSSGDLEADLLDGNLETKPRTPKKKERKNSSDDMLEVDDISGGLGGRDEAKKVKKKLSRSGSADDILGDDDDISGGLGTKKLKKKIFRSGSEDDILDGGDLKKKEKKKKEKSELVTKSSSAEDTFESDLAAPSDASKKSSSKSKDSKKKSPRASGDADDLQSFSRKNSISDAASSSSKGERSGKRSPGRDRSRELSRQHSDNHFQEQDDPYL